MDKRQKSDHYIVRRFSPNSDGKDIGIVEDEDYAIAVGKRTYSTESGIKPKSQLIQKDNVKMTPDKDAKKMKKKDGRKLLKLLKMLRAELTEKKSNKLDLFDNMEKLFEKFANRRKSSLLSDASSGKASEDSVDDSSLTDIKPSSSLSSKVKNKSKQKSSSKERMKKYKNKGVDSRIETTVDNSLQVKKDKSDAHKNLNTIRIKIDPQVDQNSHLPAQMQQSLITLEQIVDNEHPISLKVNDQPVDSTKPFKTLIKFPETIDITINSPESEAEIKLPIKSAGSESSCSSKVNQLVETQSTSSDLRSLFEAYQTDTSNFSTAFKPSPSRSSSKKSSKASSLQSNKSISPEISKSSSKTLSPEESLVKKLNKLIDADQLSTADTVATSPTLTSSNKSKESSRVLSPVTSTDDLDISEDSIKEPTSSMEAPRYVPLKPGQRLTDRKDLIADSTPVGHGPPSLKSLSDDEIKSQKEPVESDLKNKPANILGRSLFPLMDQINKLKSPVKSEKVQKDVESLEKNVKEKSKSPGASLDQIEKDASSFERAKSVGKAKSPFIDQEKLKDQPIVSSQKESDLISEKSKGKSPIVKLDEPQKSIPKDEKDVKSLEKKVKEKSKSPGENLVQTQKHLSPNLVENKVLDQIKKPFESESKTPLDLTETHDKEKSPLVGQDKLNNQSDVSPKTKELEPSIDQIVESKKSPVESLGESKPEQADNLSKLPDRIPEQKKLKDDLDEENVPLIKGKDSSEKPTDQTKIKAPLLPSSKSKKRKSKASKKAKKGIFEKKKLPFEDKKDEKSERKQLPVQTDEQKSPEGLKPDQQQKDAQIDHSPIKDVSKLDQKEKQSDQTKPFDLEKDKIESAKLSKEKPDNKLNRELSPETVEQKELDQSELESNKKTEESKPIDKAVEYEGKPLEASLKSSEFKDQSDISQPKELVQPEEEEKPKELVQPEEEEKPKELVQPEEEEKPKELVQPEEEEKSKEEKPKELEQTKKQNKKFPKSKKKAILSPKKTDDTKDKPIKKPKVQKVEKDALDEQLKKTPPKSETPKLIDQKSSEKGEDSLKSEIQSKEDDKKEFKKEKDEIPIGINDLEQKDEQTEKPIEDKPQTDEDKLTETHGKEDEINAKEKSPIEIDQKSVDESKPGEEKDKISERSAEKPSSEIDQEKLSSAKDDEQSVDQLNKVLPVEKELEQETEQTEKPIDGSRPIGRSMPIVDKKDKSPIEIDQEKSLTEDKVSERSGEKPSLEIDKEQTSSMKDQKQLADKIEKEELPDEKGLPVEKEELEQEPEQIEKPIDETRPIGRSMPIVDKDKSPIKIDQQKSLTEDKGEILGKPEDEIPEKSLLEIDKKQPSSMRDQKLTEDQIGKEESPIEKEEPGQQTDQIEKPIDEIEPTDESKPIDESERQSDKTESSKQPEKEPKNQVFESPVDNKETPELKKDDLTNQQSDLQKDNLRPTDTKEGLSIDSSVKEQPDDLKEKDQVEQIDDTKVPEKSEPLDDKKSPFETDQDKKLTDQPAKDSELDLNKKDENLEKSMPLAALPSKKPRNKKKGKKRKQDLSKKQVSFKDLDNLKKKPPSSKDENKEENLNKDDLKPSEQENLAAKEPLDYSKNQDEIDLLKLPANLNKNFNEENSLKESPSKLNLTGQPDSVPTEIGKGSASELLEVPQQTDRLERPLDGCSESGMKFSKDGSMGIIDSKDQKPFSEDNVNNLDKTKNILDQKELIPEKIDDQKLTPSHSHLKSPTVNQKHESKVPKKSKKKSKTALKDQTKQDRSEPKVVLKDKLPTNEQIESKSKLPNKDLKLPNESKDYFKPSKDDQNKLDKRPKSDQQEDLTKKEMLIKKEPSTSHKDQTVTSKFKDLLKDELKDQEDDKNLPVQRKDELQRPKNKIKPTGKKDKLKPDNLVDEDNQKDEEIPTGKEKPKDKSIIDKARTMVKSLPILASQKTSKKSKKKPALKDDQNKQDKEKPKSESKQKSTGSKDDKPKSPTKSTKSLVKDESIHKKNKTPTGKRSDDELEQPLREDRFDKDPSKIKKPSPIIELKSNQTYRDDLRKDSSPVIKKNKLKTKEDLEKLLEKIGKPDKSIEKQSSSNEDDFSPSSSSESDGYYTFSKNKEQPSKPSVISPVSSSEPKLDLKTEDSVEDENKPDEKTDEKPVEKPITNTDEKSTNSLLLTNRPQVVYSGTPNKNEEQNSIESQWLSDIVPSEEKSSPDVFSKMAESDELSDKFSKEEDNDKEGYNEHNIDQFYDNVKQSIDKKDETPALKVKKDETPSLKVKKDQQDSSTKSLKSDQISKEKPIKKASLKKPLDTSIKDIVASLNESLKGIESELKTPSKKSIESKPSSIKSKVESLKSKKSIKSQKSIKSDKLKESTLDLPINKIDSSPSSSTKDESKKQMKRMIKKCNQCQCFKCECKCHED